MIWMMAAFVLGEVWQAESSQTGMGIGIFGVFALCSIFCIVRVSESQSRRTIILEAGCLLLFFSIGVWRMKTESQEQKADLLIQKNETVKVEGTIYKIGKTAYYNQYYLKDVIIISETGERLQAGAVQLSAKAESSVTNIDKMQTLAKKEITQMQNFIQIKTPQTENFVQKEAPQTEETYQNKIGNQTKIGYQEKIETDEKNKNQVKIGNRICASGKAEIPDHATNQGAFDWYLYYRALGIRYQIKSDQIWIVDKRTDWIQEKLKEFKEQLKAVYRSICSEKDYGIFCAILLGEKQELDAEVKSLYEENGISHILAISGLHISLIGMGFYHLLRKRFGFFFSQMAAGLIMAAYVIMTGASVSTVRAYAMFLLLLTAAVVGRTYDIAVAAGWIALVLLFRNPYLIYYAGFLLSFGAIVGIGVVGSVLNQYVGSRNMALKAMISSMSVIWVTLPVSAYFFFTYATWSVALNLVVIPCMTLVMLSGIAGGLLGLFVPTAGLLGIGIGHYILCFYEKICKFAEQLPYHQILIGRPNWWQLGIYYGIVGAVCIWANWQNKQKDKKESEKGFLVSGRVVVLGSIMFFLIMVLCFRRSGKLEVTFFDVSQGDGIFLRLPSGEVGLIDGGSTDIKKVGEYRILPFLQSKRIENLDFIFISHADQDHISGVKEILESNICKVNMLCLPDIAEADTAYLGLVKMAEDSGSKVVFLKAGDRISKERLFIQCVHPLEKAVWGDRNSYSMVLWLRYGEVDFLFTGDIGEEEERKMISLLPQELEVLKVAHHGSQYSSCSDFLKWVTPKYAVISCGDKNTYGHPHTEAVERIAENGSEILLTRDSGAITFVSDGKKLKVKTFLH